MSSFPKVPVTILTGYLGSGKTTLMNHILDDQSHGLKFAIIENEFGEVGVDEKILSENTDEEIVEVMNGCICCTVRGDLVVALNKLYDKISKFDAIIIETTGLADPAPVAQTFFVDENISKKYSLDGIITVVDAKYINTRLDDEKPEGVENEAVEQVTFADRIILNKTDLVSNEAELQAIEKRLKSLSPIAQIFRASHSKVDPKHLINLKSFSLERVLEFDPEFLNTDGEHEHDSTISSVSCNFEGMVNQTHLQDWISEVLGDMGANLYRYKGLLAVAGDNRKFVFQGVGMMFSGTFSDQVWKAGEKKECRFVFIGKNLDKEFLKEGLMACQCTMELRFKVGDKVYANVGEWVPGTILKLWDDGCPYRIQLDDGQNTNVYGPVDIDQYVRKDKPPADKPEKKKPRNTPTEPSA